MQQANMKTLAIYIDKNNIGLSLFDEETVRIQCSCLYNICYPAYSLIKRLVSHCSRLLCNNPSHDIFAHLDLQHIQLQVIPEKSFEPEIIEHMLTQISTHLTNHSNPKAYTDLFSKNKCKYSSLGMLLSQILNLNMHSKLYIDDIDYFIDTLVMTVQYSRNQLQFLQISKEDIHPSLIKGQGNSKEGYSVISAYEAFLISTGSKRILRYIFTNPTYDRRVLSERQERIKWMRMHMRDGQKYSKYFRNIHVLESILKKFKRMDVEEQQWRKLINTMEAMLEIRNLINIQEAPQFIVDYVRDGNWQQVRELFNVFKNTLELSPLSIKNGVDSTLDHLKRTFDNMSHILTLIAKQQAWPMEFSIVFMTQVGYLIKIGHNSELPPSINQQQWTLQFSNNAGNFYSNGLTQSLDSEYGDLYGEIQDIEKKIIFDMESLVIEREQILLDLYWKVCEIQCFWGISQLSKNMCQPRLSSEALIISNGWHLLLTGTVINNHSFSFPQSQAPKRYVTNSQRNLVNQHYSNRCSVITGPNASGKTVYMKQLGIIVYLAHLGLYVPASFAQIPLIDSLTFVGKVESLYTDQRCGCESQLLSLSSVAMPSVISSKALVLIDELGAEIDYENALKLLYTTIEYLTNIRSPFLSNRLLSKRTDQFKTPLVCIITHLSQILRSNVLQQNYLIRFLTMSVQPQGLRLFKIKPGLVSKGYGIKTASQILSEGIVGSSEKYLFLIQQI